MATMLDEWEEIERIAKIPPEDYFKIGWPTGLESDVFYETTSDDDPDTRLRVFVSGADGDAYLSVINDHGTNGVRICTLAGGGYSHTRTRSALLMLALAMKMDNESQKG